MRNFKQVAKALITLTLVATGFVACSSDNDNGGNNEPKGDRYLTLSINTGQEMRGTVIDSDPGNSNEDKITALTVGIFNSNGDVVKIEEFTAATWTVDGTKINVTVTSQGLQAGNTVMAVANAAAGTFSGCTTLSEFKAKTMTIDQALANGTGTSEKTSEFPMVGIGKIASSTGTVNFTADVTVYHMVAKVSLAPVTVDFTSNSLYSAATFTAEEIFLYNVPSTKAFWFTPQTGASAYYSGESNAATKKEFLGSGATTIDLTKSHYLYALPNAETGDNATKLVIKGTFKATPSAAGSTIYYPIYLDYVAPATVGAAGTAAAGDLPGYASEISLTGRTPKAVYANDNYKINVTIKSIGATSPDSDLDPQEVRVSITVAPWTNLTQNTTFN